MRYVLDSNVLLHLANMALGYRTILRHVSRHGLPAYAGIDPDPGRPE